MPAEEALEVVVAVGEVVAEVVATAVTETAVAIAEEVLSGTVESAFTSRRSDDKESPSPES
jgi:hypothetical protein